MVPKTEGSWRFFADVAVGFDFDGGHGENSGVDGAGNRINVPFHRHTVSLDFTRVGVQVEHTFTAGWDLWVRAPYEIKNQRAAVRYVDPTTSTERDAILRNMNLHHRSATYSGFGDLNLLAAHWKSGFLLDNAALEFAVGTSVPVGRVEDDPYRAAALAQSHLHLQFGSGTFDPLLEAYYAVPLPAGTTLQAFSLGRFPVYENGRTYRAPVECTSGVSLSRPLVSPSLSFRAGYTFLYQGYARWDGARDPNSGLVSHGVVVAATATLPAHIHAGVGFRHSFSQRALSDDGDTFTQGPTLLLTLTGGN